VDERSFHATAAVLADAGNGTKMRQVFEKYRPAVVFHAAAYKHVPLVEANPAEAVRNNTLVTRTVADIAVEFGAKRFVLVSTDKAVWPSSVMGASKRVAEMIVADAGSRLRRPFISVRFGNVLGSNGSVVPIFQEQLEKGRPITITHPEMTRYFMTIPEASWLILDAAAIADRAGLFVLDMGEPIKIMDVARDLMRLAGRDPDTVPVTFIGLRKGEKLHESLFYDREAVHATTVPKILRSDAPRPPTHIREDVQHLLELADGSREDHLRARLHAYVRWATVAHDYPADSEDPEGALAAPIAAQPSDVVAIPVHETSNSDAGVEAFPRIYFAPVRPAGNGAADSSDVGTGGSGWAIR
jgi:FlaA1/EpsC-like NDP-sugar epimerase